MTPGEIWARLPDDARMILALCKVEEMVRCASAVPRFAIESTAALCNVDAHKLTAMWLEKLYACERARKQLQAEIEADHAIDRAKRAAASE